MSDIYDEILHPLLDGLPIEKRIDEIGALVRLLQREKQRLVNIEWERAMQEHLRLPSRTTAPPIIEKRSADDLLNDL